MSGSHGQPAPPPDGRYSLEDTIYEMPSVIKGYAHGEHVLSGAFGRPQPDAAAPEDSGTDCTVWTRKVDERLKALEAAVGALVARLEDGK